MPSPHPLPGALRWLLAWSLASLVVASCLASCAGGRAGRRPQGARGSYALDVTLPSLDGGDVSLRSFRGRVVVLHFFATWCAPCIAQVAMLNRLHRHYRDYGASVVAVGMDLEGRDVLDAFRRTMRTDYPILVATDALRAGQTPLGTISTVPMTLLLAGDGEPKDVGVGLFEPVELEDRVRRLLGVGRAVPREFREDERAPRPGKARW